MHQALAFRVDLNDGWSVRRPIGPFAAALGDAAERRPVILPHDVMRDMERTPDAPSGAGAGYSPSAAWTYEHTLAVPAAWHNHRVALEFDGAASNALVYINGTLVASRPNGYARFFAEIGPHLVYGGDNAIRVEVRTHKDSRWYSGAGLYRGVRLIVAGDIHLVDDGVAVTTPDIDDELATVEVTVRLRNASMVTRTVRVECAIARPDGGAATTDGFPVTVLAGETVTARQRLYVRDPQRWSVDDPQLHTLEVEVLDGEERLDADIVDFGIRTLQVDPVRGLRINGVSTKLRGACIHHDNGPLGGASYACAEERRMRMLKAAGFNAIRTAHNPASQALLRACDRVGMLVMNEAFDIWSDEKSEYDYARHFTEWWRRDLEALVAGSRNHPSVIMYSIGNEILELGRPTGANLNRALAEHVRALDPTRPVTNGINTFLTVDAGALIEAAGGLNALMGDDASNIFDTLAVSPEVSLAIEETAAGLDITGYNYAESRFAIDAVEHPGRVVVGSETFPTMIAANWEKVLRHPHVLGDFTWTGWDYLGEAGIGSHAYNEDEGVAPHFAREFPYLTAFCGDFDLIGTRRPASYYRELVFGLRTEPYIAVHRPNRYAHTLKWKNAWGWSDSIGSWSWPGFEGAPVRVEVYADADEVELLCNGAPLARVAVGTRMAFVADFDTVYTPGELVAVAYSDDVECGRTVLRSAEGEVRLHVAVERDTIAADGQDLAYVNIALVDAAGTVWSASDRAVSVAVAGGGECIAFGTGSPSTAERFDAMTRTTFDGRALAIVRALTEGEITVTVSAADCAPATVTITAI